MGGSGICQAGRLASKRIMGDNSPAGIVNKIEEDLSIMKVTLFNSDSGVQ